MDVNEYMNTMSKHEALAKNLEHLINKDKQDDSLLKYGLTSQKNSLEKRIEKLEAAFKKQTLFEKQIIEKAQIRDHQNLTREIDKRSSYSKFK